MEYNVSCASAAGTCRRVTNQGANKIITIQPATPSSSNKDKDVQSRGGTSSCSPVPNFCATNWVSARPSPKSKSVAYPISAQTSVTIPNRSVPKPLTTMGMQKNATSIGALVPTKFQIVLRASLCPL